MKECSVPKKECKSSLFQAALMIRLRGGMSLLHCVKERLILYPKKTKASSLPSRSSQTG